MKQLKIFLLASIFTLPVTCVHAIEVNMSPIISYLLSDTVTATPQEIAIDKIKAYADNQTNPVPTMEDYIDAGVIGVTAENIDDVNDVIVDSEVDTLEEIQAVVDSVLDNTVSFENDVMPILVDNCIDCHDTSSSRKFKVADAAYTYNNIIDNSLINTTSPDSSPILIKGNGGHNRSAEDRLTDVDSNIVRDWIEEGGLDN